MQTLVDLRARRLKVEILIAGVLRRARARNAISIRMVGVGPTRSPFLGGIKSRMAARCSD